MTRIIEQESDLSDVTDADEEALSAHVFIYTDSDEMMILSATIAASDFIA